MIGELISDKFCSEFSDSLEVIVRAKFDVPFDISLRDVLSINFWFTLGIPLGNTIEEELNDR